MLTGHGTAETAVDGMKLGAYDYLLKPADFEDLMEKLEGARARKEDQEERIRQAEAKLLVRRSGGLS
jgi:DNA-binding NtrC family response regulator